MLTKYLARVERNWQLVEKPPVGFAFFDAILVLTDLKFDVSCAARSKFKRHLDRALFAFNIEREHLRVHGLDLNTVSTSVRRQLNYFIWVRADPVAVLLQYFDFLLSFL